MKLESVSKGADNDFEIRSSECPSVVRRPSVSQGLQNRRWSEMDTNSDDAGAIPAKPFTGRLCYYLINLGALPDDASKQSYHMMEDQFLKNIGSIVVGLECSVTAQRMLEADGMEGPNPSCGGGGQSVPFEHRPSWRNHVVRMNEVGKNAILIAARTSLFSDLELLCEKNFNERDKAQSRLLICKATLKKPVDGLGRTSVIAGFHGYNETMKRVHPSASDRVWRETAGLLQQHDVDLFAGDLNMWMLRVPETLRNFGITCDTLAYYPFELGKDIQPEFSIRIGLDSMAMFWLKGQVEAWVNWPYNHIGKLKDAGNPSCGGAVKSDFGESLDKYEQIGMFPGQHWSRYRATDLSKEPDNQKNFEKSMREFLAHSTPVETWKRKLAAEGHRSWHRLKQKKCDPANFFVAGKYFGGTHLPLVVFTENATTRSELAKKARHAKRNQSANVPH